MSVFPNWQRFIVKQKRPATGCIPTGYEMILRAAGINHVDFNSFQDDFDLDKNLRAGDRPRNNFASVAQEIRSKYPDIHFKSLCFAKTDGPKKLEAVERIISQGIWVLISIALVPFCGKGWHIVPVVDLSTDSLILLWGVNDNGEPQTKSLRKTDFIYIHENYLGGEDIAFLER